MCCYLTYNVVVQVAQVCIRVGAEWRWKRQSGGRRGQRQLEVSGEGEGRSYHDITPLLCHYVVGGIVPCVLNGSIIMILYHGNYGRTWTSEITKNRGRLTWTQ